VETFARYFSRRLSFRQIRS